MTLDARTIAKVMGGDVNGDGALVPGPGHSPKDRSLSVKPDPSARDGFVVYSFAGDEVGECRDHVKGKLGISSEPLPKSNGAGTGRRITNTYDYFNEHGELLFQAIRYEPKGFSQRRPDANGWTWNLEGVRRVPYRLPDLVEAVAARKVVVIVEGEKDVDALRGLGIAATTCSGGAGKWRDEYSQHFKGASIVIVGDNDDPGRDHARSVAQALTGVAARVRLIDLAVCWPECPVKGDISDWLGAGGTREQLVEWIKGAPDYSEAEPGAEPPRWKDRTFCADALQTMQFAPLSYLLPGLIPEGLCLLVSRPKLGKSWLVLDVAIATAASRFVLGELKPASGDALYLALEDGRRRLQRRLMKLLPSGMWPPGLTFATEWPRSDQGGLSDIEGWIKSSKNPRLVIVDTLAQFRKIATGKDVYLEDSLAISGLQKLASKYSLTIIVVHHDRKSMADDVFDTVSGSLGLTGAADTIAILKRQAGAVTLHVRGRDVEEAEKALQFDKATCRWTIIGEASEIRRSSERNGVLEALQGAGAEGMSPADLTNELGISPANARQLLHRMAKDGEIQKGKYGHYFHNGVTPVTASHQKKKANKTNSIDCESDSVTSVTAPEKTAVPVTLPAEDYLGPPGDNPADFLGDIPDFLDRRKQQARN